MNKKSKSDDVPKKKKKLDCIVPTPKCPNCKTNFSNEPFNDSSPIMSMSCFHTICFGCAQLSVKYNRMKLKRPNINSSHCPIENCLAKNAFRYNSENWNMCLIEYVNEIQSYTEKL